MLRELNDKRARILDFGCGFGKTIASLKAEGYENVYGVDIENSAIKYCGENQLEVRKVDPQNYQNPFAQKFDVIILSHIIEHIEKKKLIDALKEIKRVFLNENGFLLVAVPNAQSATGAFYLHDDWTHETLFTSGSLYYVFKAAGFSEVQFCDIDCTIHQPLHLKLVRKFLLGAFKLKQRLWNIATASMHNPRFPAIFSHEIKAKIQ